MKIATIDFKPSQSTSLSRIVLSNEDAQHPYMLLKIQSRELTTKIAGIIRSELRFAVMTDEKEQQPKFRLAEVNEAQSFIKLEGNLLQAMNVLKGNLIFNDTLTSLLLSNDEVEASEIIKSTKDFALEEDAPIIDIAEPATQLNQPIREHVEAVINDLKSSTAEQQKTCLDALTIGLKSLGIKADFKLSTPPTSHIPVLAR